MNTATHATLGWMKWTGAAALIVTGVCLVAAGAETAWRKHQINQALRELRQLVENDHSPQTPDSARGPWTGAANSAPIQPDRMVFVTSSVPSGAGMRLVMACPPGDEDGRLEFLRYAGDRALREADACALRAALELQHVMLESVRGNGVRFFEELNGLVSAGKALSGRALQQHVQAKFRTMILSDRELEEKITAITARYEAQLERIAGRMVLECGSDIDLPGLQITAGDFVTKSQKDLDEALAPSVGALRQVLAIESGINIAMVAYSFALPIPLYVDAIVCATVELALNGYWAPEEGLDQILQQDMSRWTERIVMGDDTRPGIYPSLLLASREYMGQVLDRAVVEALDGTQPPAPENTPLVSFMKEQGTDLGWLGQMEGKD